MISGTRMLRGIPGKGWFVEHFALMIELTRMLANLQLGKGRICFLFFFFPFFLAPNHGEITNGWCTSAIIAILGLK